MVAKLLVLLFERDKAVRHANLATVIVSHAYGNLTHTTMGAAMKILKTQYIDQESWMELGKEGRTRSWG
jgi:hypothetical protein